MASVDTNVLVRWITRDSPKHVARTEALLAEQAPLYISPVALAELEHVLRSVYVFPRNLISGHFAAIIASGLFEVNEQLLLDVLRSYDAHPALSFVDCWLAADAAAQAKGPLYTYDKKLARQLPDAKEVK